MTLSPLLASAAFGCTYAQVLELVWPARNATNVPLNASVVVHFGLGPGPDPLFPKEEVVLRLAGTSTPISVSYERLPFASQSGRVRLTPAAPLPALQVIEVVYLGTYAMGAPGGLIGQFTTGSLEAIGAPAAPSSITIHLGQTDLPPFENPVCGAFARVRPVTLGLPDAGHAGWYSITEGDAGITVERSGPTRGFVICDPPYTQEVVGTWRISGGVHDLLVTAVSASGVASPGLVVRFDATCVVAPNAGPGSGAPIDAGLPLDGGGPADGGSHPADGGPHPAYGGSSPSSGSGCGCSAAPPGLGFVLLALLALRNRRRAEVR